MSLFQLDPQSLAQRARAAGMKPPSLGASLIRGALGFAVVSIAGFVPWAVFGGWFHHHGGEVALYIACTVIFVGLSGLLMHRLIIGSGSLSRFYQLFSGAFAAYAVAWIVGWMTLRGNPGSLAGLFAGAVVMGFILAAAFEALGALVPVILALFLLNAAGYFIGGVFEGLLMQQHQPLLAKLQWGLCYGLGSGAGLGLAFYLCQRRARTLLAQSARSL
ncbi:MAG TPA: hypothetical protein VGH90_02240 [Chthoniobacteraceae bacterium]|jgi:hypothetical protein